MESYLVGAEKRSIFLDTGQGIYRVYTLEFRKGSFYVLDNSHFGDHFSYHPDGNCFYHSQGVRVLKKVREPLALQSGRESIRLTQFMIANFEQQKPRSPKSTDIVVIQRAPLFIEMILSDTDEILDPRENVQDLGSYRLKLGPVWITLEVFRTHEAILPTFRFQKYVWKDGENVFFLGQNRA